MTHHCNATIHHREAMNAHNPPQFNTVLSTIQAGSTMVASQPPTNVHDLVVVM